MNILLDVIPGALCTRTYLAVLNQIFSPFSTVLLMKTFLCFCFQTRRAIEICVAYRRA
jgi:hypothetical protein